MQIVRGEMRHVAEVAALRHALWPEEGSLAEHQAEQRDQLLERDTADYALFVALDAVEAVIAFAEVTRRTDHVNGCDGSPVAFLEGIYVSPGHRRRGVARALVAATRDWGLSQGCAEFASDALLDNDPSHAFHKAVGFEETERVVYFRMADEATA
jgi:aminoglycoside 6'-N-acetyltransferase I